MGNRGWSDRHRPRHRHVERPCGTGHRVEGTPVLDRFGQVGLPPGAVRDGEVADPTLSPTLSSQLWASAKFSKKDVVLGISNQKVFVRLVDLP